MNGFRIPGNEELDMHQFDGSMQRILNMNLGQYVICEFLVGTNVTTTKKGYLYTVGAKYVVLYDPQSGYYQVCDIFSIKFVTFVENAGELPVAEESAR